MARETLDDVWSAVLAQCPSAGAELARHWAIDTYRDLAERRMWSWRARRGKFSVRDAHTAGAITTTQNSTTVLGNGTGWPTTIAGRQLKYGDLIYDILTRVSATQLELAEPWLGASVTDGAYSIQDIYLTPASDFQRFDTVINPEQDERLVTDLTAAEIDYYDPSRTGSGDPCCLAHANYARVYSGAVGPAYEVAYSASPISGTVYPSGTFTGKTQTIFTIKITSNGGVGVSTYNWYANGILVSTGTTSASPTLLQNGVRVAFDDSPSGLASGDVFAFVATPLAANGLPRFELYPHATSALVLPYTYFADIEADNPASNGGVLPRYIPGHVLREGALARAARWPGSVESPNPYAQIARAETHERRFEAMVHRLELEDDDIMSRNISRESMMPYAHLPWGARTGNYQQDTDYGW